MLSSIFNVLNFVYVLFFMLSTCARNVPILQIIPVLNKLLFAYDFSLFAGCSMRMNKFSRIHNKMTFLLVKNILNASDAGKIYKFTKMLSLSKPRTIIKIFSLISFFIFYPHFEF